MESSLNLSVYTFLSQYMTNRVGHLVRKYGNKYKTFQCKFSEIRAVSGLNIDQNACGDLI